MDRSFAARLTRPFAMPATRRGVSRAAGSRSRSAGRPVARTGTGAGEALRAGLPALAGGALEGLRSATARVWAGRRTRAALICALIAIPLLAGGWFALRNSSFVAVQRVHVSGVHGPQARAIEAALVAAGKRMSTLDVKPAALRAAVAGYPLVREVKAVAQVPHGLHVEVVEQPPVAALQIGSLKTAVAADGVVLGPGLLSSSLPAVGGYRLPLPGEHVHDGGLLAYLTVLGAAPAPLARQIARVYSGPQGLTVAMRNGLLAYFGDTTRSHAKWFALTRVLADESSAGATYVDVRLPARPAAGFPAGAGPAASSSEAPATPGAGKESESAVAALAQGLTPPGAATAPVSPVEAAAGAKAEEPSTGSAAGATGTEKPSESTSSEAHETPSSTGSEATPSTATPGG
jgi:cell division septal protein FtsQ